MKNKERLLLFNFLKNFLDKIKKRPDSYIEGLFGFHKSNFAKQTLSTAWVKCRKEGNSMRHLIGQLSRRHQAYARISNNSRCCIVIARGS